MTMPTIFKSEVGDILRALALSGEDRSQDYLDALTAVALALGLVPPEEKIVEHRPRERDR